MRKGGIFTDKLHEECGVFGIYDKAGKNVSDDLYTGLMALQHRGQEAAGMSVSETDGPKGNVKTLKGPGLVCEVFTPDDIIKLRGNIGVAHVRYSTSGGSSPENAQPIAMRYIKGSLALVHNGNLINADQIKQEQMLRGQAHFTTSDSEVFAYEIISKRLKCASIENAIVKAAAKMQGGYACIVMSPRKFVGVRDPYGIRPLVLGKRKDAWILASESAAIQAVGGELIRDVDPGEVVVLTKSGIRSDRTLCTGRSAHCVFEYIYFARNDSVIDGIEVRQARFQAGRALAWRHPADADIVTGVPESGLSAAEGYAAESGIPLAHALYKNNYIGRSFIKPTDRERQSAVHMKLSPVRSAVEGKRVVLIDDSIVRGTTMKQIVSMLRGAGAAQVHVRVSSPPFLYPCYYGVDVPHNNQLVASHHSAAEVCRMIGADSLGYLKTDDFRQMTGGLSLCTACFDNRYPAGERAQLC